MELIWKTDLRKMAFRFLFRALFPGLVLILGNLRVCASNSLDWANRQLALSLEVYEDRNGSLEFQDVGHLPPSAFRAGSVTQNFGFTLSAWWLRFHLHNPEEREEKFYLRLANGHIHSVDFWLVRDGQAEQVHTGNALLSSTKPVRYTEYLFPVELPAGQSCTIYLRLEKKGAELYAPLSILRGDYDPAGNFNTWNLLFGAAFLYILILFIASCIIRTRLIVFYFLYAASLCLYIATVKGIAPAMIWPNQPWIQINALELSKHLANIFYILFILKFIGKDHRSSTLIGFLKICIGLSALNLVCRLIYSTLGVIPDALMMRFVQLTALLLPAAAVCLAILLYRAWRTNKKSEEFWLLFITTALLVPLAFLVCLHFGWIPAYPYYSNLLAFLFLVEIAGISAILVYRYYQLYRKELFHLREITRLKRKAVENILLGQEEERIRIARDLHDGLGMSLAHIRMNLSLLDQYVGPGRGKGLLNGLLGSVGDAAKEVRGISHNLAPLSLQHQELTKALEELVYRIELTDATLDIELHFAPDINTSLSPIVKQNIYQTAKELFNNIVKYASASQIRVRLHRDQDHYKLELEDNGMPYDLEKAMAESGGMGLSSIRSRATLLNGWFIALPGRNGGMIHQFSIPVSA